MTEYFEITFNPFKTSGRVKKDATVFEAAAQLGVALRSDCGQQGTCGKCRVMVDNPANLTPPGKHERTLLPASRLDAGHRLACQARLTGPVTVTVPRSLRSDQEVFTKTAVEGTFAVNDVNRGVTANCKGNQTSSLGIAMDIGTTTLAVYLCDLISGRVLSAAAAANPQRRLGEDVIARIAAIRADKSSLEKQQTLVTTALNDLIKSCLSAAGQVTAAVDDLTVVGNTTMEHILAGLNPGSIGLAPYRPVTCKPVLTAARNLDLDLLPTTPVYIFPVISGFLGGDILAALLADRPYERRGTTLLIDIGTNGELLLCNGRDLWATSCATGPALEGAQISCGMRASAGAVSRVTLDPVRPDRILFETVGNKDPIGICGSGMIDALAAMRRAGITRPDGSFNPDGPGVHCDDQGVGRTFRLPGSSLHIALKDVRQVQLAKAALRVGIQALLKHAGVTRLDRTVLTGAFGAAFNWHSARDIGLLSPGDLHGEVDSVPNLAGIGAIMALLNQQRRAEIEALALEIKCLDLAAEPDFTNRFSEATRFPEIHAKA